MDINQIVTANKICKVVAGSRAYGTDTPESDYDFRGIFCANPINIRTPFFPVKEKSDETEEDTKYFEVANFLNLYTSCNPNIVELLWVDEADVIETSSAYEYLRSHRRDLLSKKAAFTFSGYAMSQMKRIKGHNKWINNPQPVNPPAQSDYLSLVQNFTEDKIFKLNFSEYNDDHRLIHYGQNIYGLVAEKGYQVYDQDGILNTNSEHVDIADRKHPLFIVKFNKEEYKVDKERHSNYWEWKSNRNQARSSLEEEHGYDTKHAMHLLRLLTMCEEILETGEIKVRRPDAAYLLEVRNGLLSYDELIAIAEEKDNRCRTVLYPNCDILPKSPNIKLAAEVLMDVQDIMWGFPNVK